MKRLSVLLLSLCLIASPSWSQIGPLPGMAVLPPPSAATCAPAGTNIGTNSNTAGATLTLTGVTVPAASLIVVAIAEEATSGTISAIGSLSDGVNTYTLATSIKQNNTTSGIVGVYFAANASLSSGTITYTKNVSGNIAQISAVYTGGIQSLNPLDGAVTATAFGSSTAPSVTSGTPAQSGELFIGALGTFGGSAITITQDTGHGWSFPPNTVASGTVPNIGNVSGGNQINSGTGTKIYAPTLSASSIWGAIAVGFKHC